MDFVLKQISTSIREGRNPHLRVTVENEPEIQADSGKV